MYNIYSGLVSCMHYKFGIIFLMTTYICENLFLLVLPIDTSHTNCMSCKNIGDNSLFLAILCRPFGFLAPKDL
jgi:hypothetical protein